MEGLVAVVLAAGEGKRMKSDRPKVLHELCGRPMIEYVLDAARAAGCNRLLVVVGHKAEQVQDKLSRYEDLSFVLQEQQMGTGHAVEVCRSQLVDHEGDVLVLAGDAPLVMGDSLGELVEQRKQTNAACVFGTAIVSQPHGLGRIVRDPTGGFQAIVEERDATPEQKAICEINPSYYVFRCSDLLEALSNLKPLNAQGEYYLTDCPRFLLDQGKVVIALNAMEAEESYGVNSRAQLAQLHTILQQRIQQHWMAEGVSIVDPSNTYIDSRVTIGRETVVLPFTVLEGPATIGRSCRIGPFSHVRPGTNLADKDQIGSFNNGTGS